MKKNSLRVGMKNKVAKIMSVISYAYLTMSIALCDAFGQDVTIKDNIGTITLNWDLVTEGANGGVIVPDKMKYKNG